MKKKLLSLLLCTCMAATLTTGCGNSAETDVKEKETQAPASKEVESTPKSTGTTLTYKGELKLMHFSTSEEAEGNGGSDGFRKMCDEWENANPDVKLAQNILNNADYKSMITTLAGSNDLPDVFLLQGMNTRTWADQGLILDMTDYINKSPYADKYNQDKFTPFEYNGKIYGLPALTEGTCAIVAYDAKAWKEAGFDSFPKTWKELIAAKDAFAKKNITPVAFGNQGKWNINSCFLSTIGDRFTGPEWFQSMVDKKGAKFTDKAFVDALKATKDIFASGVFNKDFNAITNEDAREYYIEGSAAAFIGGNWDISYIYGILKEEGGELFENTKFAVIPQPDGATATQDTHNTGMGYAVAINAKLADNPEKLAAAVDLAYKLTGEDFSKYVAENYALSALTKVDNVDMSKFDQYTLDFYNFYKNPGCEIYDSYLAPAVWDILNTDLQDMLNGDIEPEKVAEKAQQAYEKNYLK